MSYERSGGGDGGGEECECSFRMFQILHTSNTREWRIRGRACSRRAEVRGEGRL